MLCNTFATGMELIFWCMCIAFILSYRSNKKKEWQGLIVYNYIWKAVTARNSDLHVLLQLVKKVFKPIFCSNFFLYFAQTCKFNYHNCRFIYMLDWQNFPAHQDLFVDFMQTKKKNYFWKQFKKGPGAKSPF